MKLIQIILLESRCTFVIRNADKYVSSKTNNLSTNDKYIDKEIENKSQIK